MPEVIHHCPNPRCAAELRVPEELLGSAVRCPRCRGVFNVPRRREASPSRSAIQQPRARGEGRSIREDERPIDPEHVRRNRIKFLVTPPAVGMLVASGLGIAFNVFRVYIAATGTYSQPDPSLPEWWQKIDEATQTNGALPPAIDGAVGAVLLLAYLPALVAGVQMLRLKTYWLALSGTMVAMANCTCPCVMLGLPFGVWALVVLLLPAVREAFD